ncbi:MAG: hypothetical protein IMZ55_18045 [Acidobacteria bacterium]|nr:hypothetical protein [Acidobacteriota bacterium]
MTNPDTPTGRFEIRSEARGPHWIAWLARESGGTPVNAVVLVGETREEAEARALKYERQLIDRGEA